jgi:pimeloyl-ACP methyl ester carboxylesterase
MALDVSELIDILGASQVDLVGYSMGTVVALTVASREPRVRRLVAGGIGESAVIQRGVDRLVLPREAIVEAMLAGDPGTIQHPVDAIVSAELAIKISAITPGSLEIQRSRQLWWSSFAEARSPLQSG